MSAMPSRDTVSFSWSMKLTPVEYSVRSPTKMPPITCLPFKISFFLVQPNLWLSLATWSAFRALK